jgi:hypothetical protein
MPIWLVNGFSNKGLPSFGLLGGVISDVVVAPAAQPTRVHPLVRVRARRRKLLPPVVVVARLAHTLRVELPIRVLTADDGVYLGLLLGHKSIG